MHDKIYFTKVIRFPHIRIVFLFFIQLITLSIDYAKQKIKIKNKIKIHKKLSYFFLLQKHIF